MAHIPDGILSAQVLIGSGVLTAAGVALGLRRLDDRMIPKAALLSAVFFAGSLIAVPMGPSSVHLLFAGLMGLMLGLAAFPALLVALTLQTLLFGFGGLTTLGANTLNIALPGVVAALLVGPLVRSGRPGPALVGGALCGALAVLGTGLMVAGSLWLSAPEFAPVARVMLVTYLPLALGEAAVTAAAIGFLLKVQPDAVRARPA